MTQTSTAQNNQGQSSGAVVTFTINNQTICLEANKYAALMDDVHFSDPEASFEENLKKQGIVLSKPSTPAIN